MGSTLSSSGNSNEAVIGKLLDSASSKYGPEVSAALSTMTKDNPLAGEMLKQLDNIPSEPVPDNIYDFLTEDIDKTAEELAKAAGIDKVVAYNTLKSAALTIRSIGIASIPVIAGLAVGIPAGLAAGAAGAAVTGPGGIITGITAAAAAGIPVAMETHAAISQAEDVQQFIINKIRAVKTPGFIKSANATIGKIKTGLMDFIRKHNPYSGSYEAAKRHYGRKSGACDCDFIGGAEEEDISVKSAREYLKTSSSASKRELVADITNVLKDLLKLEPPTGMNDVETARWLLAHMPGQEKGKNISNNPATLKKACDKLAELINKYAGIEVINKDLPAEAICAQLVEMAHALTVGMHMEFLVVQADLKNIEANLSWLGDLAEMISGTILEKTRSEMSDHERVELIHARDALGLVMAEIKRQMALVRALTTGTLAGIDKNITQLIKEGTFLQSGISNASKPGDASFRDTVYKVLQGISITAAMASLIESALKEVGIKVDEYRSFNTMNQLNDAIAKVLPGMDDTEKLYKFFRSVELLQKHFGDRKEYKMGSFDEPRYPKTEMEKKVEGKTNVIAVNLRTFARKLKAIYDAFEESLKKASHAIGTDIKIGDSLKLFIDRLKLLKQDALISGEIYHALAGEHTDALAKQKKDEVLGTYNNLIAAVDMLMPSATGAGAAALTGIKESISAIIRLSEESTNAFKKITGGADLTEAFNVDTAMKRGTLNLAKTIDTMIAYYKIAEVRKNIADAGITYTGTTSEYEQLCGQAVAGVIDDLRAEEEKIMKDLSDYRTGKTEAEIKELDAVRKFFEGHFKARREFWEVVEAVEYYLANFTSDIRLHANEITDLASLLQGVEVIKNWYDNKTGDLFTAVFDNFPIHAHGTGAAKVDLTNDARIAAGGAFVIYSGVGNNVDNSVVYLPEAMRNGTSKVDHYYENFNNKQAGGGPTHFRAGNPYIYAHPSYGLNAVNVAGKALSRFAVLKNLVSIFYVLGQKYGGEKLKESSKYITPTTVYKRLMNFIQNASFYAGNKGFIMTDEQLIKAKAIWIEYMKAPNVDGGCAVTAAGLHGASLGIVEALTKENFFQHDADAYTGGIGAITIATILLNFMNNDRVRGGGGGGAIRPAEKKCYDALVELFHGEGALMQAAGNYSMSHRYKDMGLLRTPVNNDYPGDGNFGNLGMQLGVRTTADDVRSRYGIYMRSCNVTSLKGSSSLLKDDQMFCQLIKAMVAKVFACVQTFEIMEKPLDYNAQNAPVRFILGAADVPLNVRPEYTELYIRLPLLVQFYRKVFSINKELNDADFTKYDVLDKSNSKMLKISMLPEFDGKFSGLISYMFKKAAADNVTNYTQFELERLIEKINDIIDKQASKDPETVIREILNEFVREVNKKYALVTKEDVKLYIENFLHEQYTYNPIGEEKYNTEVLSNIAMIDEDDISDSASLPSRVYRGIQEGKLTTALDTNALARLKAKKFYGEYIDMVTRFRRLIDKELLDAPETTPLIGKIIEGSKKQIMQEKDMTKRLDLIAKIIHGDARLPDTETAIYTAFHEFVVNGLDVLNAAHAFISGIVNVCAAVDPKNLLDIITATMARDVGGVDPIGNAITRTNFGANCNLDALTTKGINITILRKLLKGILGENHAVRNKSAVNMYAGSLTSNAAAGGLLINKAAMDANNRRSRDNYEIRNIYDVDFTAELIIETIYALCNAKDLFDVHISKDRVNVNYSGFVEHVKRLHASIMSNADKFRPYINKGIYDMYMDTNVTGSVYDIYDKLIHRVVEGKYLSDVNQIGVKYYGLESAFEGLNNAIPLVFHGLDRRQIMGRLFTKMLYFDTSDRGSGLISNNSSNEHGKFNNAINVGGHFNAFVSPTLVDWSLRKGSSIERMHLATEAGKPTFDTRFAARWPHLYSWDGPMPLNKSLFLGLNQIAARLLNSCFDASNEKIYKAAIAPFMRSFAQSINSPLNDGYPDVWPGLYINEKGRVLSKIVDTDQVIIERNPLEFARNLARPTQDQSKLTFGMLAGIDARATSTLGIPTGNYPRLYNDQLSWHDDDIRNWAGRKAPSVDGLLFSSIANIVKNISSNKTASGALLNMAESLAELTEFSKNRMREDLPLLKAYLDEFKARATLLKNIIEEWSIEFTPPVIQHAQNVYPNVTMKNSFNNANDMKEYMIRLTNKFIEVSDIFNKSIEDMSRELSITHEFGELYPGFIKSYSGNNGVLPFVPLSLATGAIALGRSIADKPWNTLVPTTRDNYKKFLTNVVLALDDAGIKNSAVIGQLTDHFNKTVNGPERFQLSDIAGMIDSISKLLRHFISGRAFKTAFTNARISENYNRYNEDEQYRMSFPEYETRGGDTETPDMYINVPYCPQYVVPARAERFPGINLYEPIMVHPVPLAGDTIDTSKAQMTHGKFIDLNAIELFISNAPVTEVSRQYKVISDTFVPHGAELGGRPSLVISNIIDMNIIPIDFTGLSKFVPLNNVINYAYTLDRLALDILVPNNLTKKAILGDLLGTESQITSTAEYVFHLIVNPFASTSGPTGNPVVNGNSDTERLFVRNMMLGDSEVPIGRPKFLSDQIFQKSMFGEFYHNNNEYNDIGHHVAPINIQRSVRPTADDRFARGTAPIAPRADSYLVMNNRIVGGFDPVGDADKIHELLGLKVFVELTNEILGGKMAQINAEVDRLRGATALTNPRSAMTLSTHNTGLANYVNSETPQNALINASFNGIDAVVAGSIPVRMIDVATMQVYLNNLGININHDGGRNLIVTLNYSSLFSIVLRYPNMIVNTGIFGTAPPADIYADPFDKDEIIRKYSREVSVNTNVIEFITSVGGAEKIYPLMDAQEYLRNQLREYAATKLIDELQDTNGMWDEYVSYTSAADSIENAVTRYLYAWENNLENPMKLKKATDAGRIRDDLETNRTANTLIDGTNAITYFNERKPIVDAQIASVLVDLRLFGVVKKATKGKDNEDINFANQRANGVNWTYIKKIENDIPTRHKMLEAFAKDEGQCKLAIALALRMDLFRSEDVFNDKSKMDQVKHIFTKHKQLSDIIKEMSLVLGAGLVLVPGLTKYNVARTPSNKATVPPHQKLAKVIGLESKAKNIDPADAENAPVERNVTANLKYIDAKRFGVGRIAEVAIQVDQKTPLLAVGNYRYNTVFIRTLIFLVNAYRILLFRLRQDTKNRHEAIATKPGDILDDNDTEFYGFDQYE